MYIYAVIVRSNYAMFIFNSPSKIFNLFKTIRMLQRNYFIFLKKKKLKKKTKYVIISMTLQLFVDWFS